MRYGSNALTAERLIIFTLSALATVSVLADATAKAGTSHPNEGDLLYDGESYFDAYMLWDDPTWTTSEPGYEHDLKITKGYFADCTSWTSLPDGYDDCPTSGVRDPAGKEIFGFGSFDANRINANTEYYGAWSFTGGPNGIGHASLHWQEVEHQAVCDTIFGKIDSIWCMEGVNGGPLINRSRIEPGSWRYWTYSN